MMNRITKMLYPDYSILITSKVQYFACDVMFAKGISLLYIFDDESDLCEVLKNCELCIFDYTFSKKGKIKTTIGSGKKTTFLNLRKVKKLLNVPGKTLILNKSKRRYAVNNKDKITYECIYGNEKVVKQYLKNDVL